MESVTRLICRPFASRRIRLSYRGTRYRHCRADIAELCGVSPATVKKYWAERKATAAAS